jgi:hypothetical protein
MSIRIHAGFVGGKDFSGWVRAVRDAGAVAVQAGVSTAATELRDEMRNQVSEAGIGERLGQCHRRQSLSAARRRALSPRRALRLPAGRKATAIFDSLQLGFRDHGAPGPLSGNSDRERGARQSLRQADARGIPAPDRHQAASLSVSQNGHLVLIGEASRR